MVLPTLLAQTLDEALVMIRRGLEKDPLSLALNMTEGWLLYMARKYELSIDQYQKALELDPTSAQTISGLAAAYEMSGQSLQAFEQYQKWAKNGGVAESQIAALTAAYTSRGMRGYWLKRLAMEIEEEEKTGDIWTFEMASLYARVGNTKQALSWLERAYEEHHDRLIALNVDPIFDGLRSELRFIKLIQRIGFP